MKRQFYALVVLLITSLVANAQVGIGTKTPVASSMLDITSTTKGFLMPRMLTAERTAIVSPVAGLQVFDTTSNTIWFFDGTAWKDSGTSTNIYNSNGALTSNRSVNMADKNLQFNATTGKFILNTIAGSQAFTQTGAGIFGIDAPNVSNGRFVVLENGNVGIGTATPSTTLHVNGIITATKIQGPSDSRFKKNIKPIQNALEKVMQLGGYTYDWKEAKDFPGQTLGNGHDMGVIAQEVEKQFPEAVSTNDQGFKAVSYTELVPALIEAIKAQQAQINELKAEMEKLKK